MIIIINGTTKHRGPTKKGQGKSNIRRLLTSTYRHGLNILKANIHIAQDAILISLIDHSHTPSKQPHSNKEPEKEPESPTINTWTFADFPFCCDNCDINV